MYTTPRPCRLLLTILFLAANLPTRAHDVTPEMADAANRLLAALTPEQKAKATYEMKSEERFNWDFVPKARAGLTFKEMTPAQRLLGHALLVTGLSHRGYANAVTIMSLDQILYELENQSAQRDPERYYLTFFGQPSPTNAWGWRVEGHHLSVNFTVVGGQEIATSPLFFGSNPAEVRQGPRQGLRVLGREEDLGYELVRSLDDEQKRVAIYTNVAPQEIITGKKRAVSLLSPAGLSATQLKPDQRKLLQQLVSEFAHRLRTELAESDLKRIEAAGWDKVQFAWAGALQAGQGHYYRIQGPTFMVEFDNTQNNANHIHTVWRDLQNDFGGDALRRHYEQTPHEK